MPSLPGSHTTTSHLPAIDGLRGLAALSVVFFHYSWNDRVILPFGWIGVDLFFVISGFLITGILLNNRERQGYFKNFYIRRALRIWPLYYVVLLGIFLISGLHLMSGPGPQKPLWVYALFLQNIVGHQGGPPRSLLVMWSLGVEEQFYLVWPLLCWKAPRRVLMWICLALLVAAPLCRFIAIQHGWYDDRIRAFPLCCFDGLAGGALLALLVRSRSMTLVRLKWLSLVAAFCGIPLFAFLSYAAPLTTGWVLSFSCLGIGFTGLVALSLWWGKSIFGFAPLRAVGTVSYGLYLYHALVLALTAKFVHDGNRHTAAALVGSLVVATISYHAFEKPILSLKERLAPNAAPAVTAVTSESA